MMGTNYNQCRDAADATTVAMGEDGTRLECSRCGWHKQATSREEAAAHLTDHFYRSGSPYGHRIISSPIHPE